MVIGGFSAPASLANPVDSPTQATPHLRAALRLIFKAYPPSLRQGWRCARPDVAASRGRQCCAKHDLNSTRDANRLASLYERIVYKKYLVVELRFCNS